MSKTKRMDSYTPDELFKLISRTSLKKVSNATHKTIKRELKYLKKQQERAIHIFGNTSTTMHEKSRDSRSKIQYIHGLINGWLAEAAAREAILRKLYGRRRVKRVVRRYSIINHHFTDMGDCIVTTRENKKILFEIKSSMSLRGMEGKNGDRIFGLKVHGTNLLVRQAKRTGAKPAVLWYIIRKGIFYIQTPEEFYEMIEGKIVSRPEWGKECYIFPIPPEEAWEKVDNIWTTR